MCLRCHFSYHFCDETVREGGEGACDPLFFGKILLGLGFWRLSSFCFNIEIFLFGREATTLECNFGNSEFTTIVGIH